MGKAAMPRSGRADWASENVTFPDSRRFCLLVNLTDRCVRGKLAELPLFTSAPYSDAWQECRDRKRE